jgi:hypothetical protein
VLAGARTDLLRRRREAVLAFLAADPTVGSSPQPAIRVCLLALRGGALRADLPGGGRVGGGGRLDGGGNVGLDPGEAERIAALVADAVRCEPPARFLDAAATARMLSVERDWVYEHAEELGAVRLAGRRGRLRFDRREVCDRLARRRDQDLAGGRKPDRPSVQPMRRRSRHCGRGRREA